MIRRQRERQDLAQQVEASKTAVRADKIATRDRAKRQYRSAGRSVLQDGRADTLQIQAAGPLLDPREMDGGSMEIAAEKLRHAPYAKKVCGSCSAREFTKDTKLSWRPRRCSPSGAIRSRSRASIPYTSKYDYWLEGRARMSEAEMRGLRLFNDPEKANCAGCHTAEPSRDGLRPPLFTDTQYEKRWCAA